MPTEEETSSEEETEWYQCDHCGTDLGTTKPQRCPCGSKSIKTRYIYNLTENTGEPDTGEPEPTWIEKMTDLYERSQTAAKERNGGQVHQLTREMNNLTSKLVQDYEQSKRELTRIEALALIEVATNMDEATKLKMIERIKMEREHHPHWDGDSNRIITALGAIDKAMLSTAIICECLQPFTDEMIYKQHQALVHNINSFSKEDTLTVWYTTKGAKRHLARNCAKLAKYPDTYVTTETAIIINDREIFFPERIRPSGSYQSVASYKTEPMNKICMTCYTKYMPKKKGKKGKAKKA